MNDQQIDSKPESDDLAFWFPTAYMILSVLIVIVVALTWFIPARQYDRALTEEVGHEIAVPGTFRTVDPNPQWFVNVMLAPMAGFYDPDSYAANAIDAALFVLLLGGFLGVVNATKAIDTGIQTAMGWMRGSDFSAMVAASGRLLFTSNACVVWHSENGIGCRGASPLDASSMDQPMNPFGFAARMGRGAESMLMMQRYELGDVIHLSGQKLADVVSLVKPWMNRPSYLTRTFPSLRN